MKYKVKCTVSYDGSQFYGYQRQDKGRTVQQEIEAALLKIEKEDITIYAAGRTDAGVHALGQVFHFNTKLKINESNWKRAINSIIPADIHIKDVEYVEESFHARYSAKEKEYRYYISLAEYNPLRRNYVYYPRHKLDIDKMKEAIKLYEGTHDFTSFSSNFDNPNQIRTIYEAKINHEGDELEFIFRDRKSVV